MRGSSGRKPFSPTEEKAILKIVRKPQQWPCFVGIADTKVGLQGFKGKAFHEKFRSNYDQSLQANRDSISDMMRGNPPPLDLSLGVKNGIDLRLSSYEVFLEYAAKVSFLLSVFCSTLPLILGRLSNSFKSLL